MYFFLDTANLDEIIKYAEWGMVDGVTTNPTLIAREGVDLETRIREISEVIAGPVSTEVLATKAPAMVKEAKEYVNWGKNIVVKIPMTQEGLIAVRELNKEGIKTNVTLIFSLPQALMAAKAGATFVSPFVGRLDDTGENGMFVVEEIMKAFTNYNFESNVIVASVRSIQHVVSSALLGANIATVPSKIMEQLVQHPLTDKGIKQFLDDWKNSQKK